MFFVGLRWTNEERTLYVLFYAANESRNRVLDVSVGNKNALPGDSFRTQRKRFAISIVPKSIYMYVHIFYALFKRTTFHLRSQFPPLSILSFVFTTPPYLEKPWDTANKSVYALLRASLIHSRGGTRGEPVFLHRTGRAIGSGKNIQTSLPGTNGTIRCAEIGQIPSKTFDAKQQTLAADNRRFPLLER